MCGFVGELRIRGTVDMDALERMVATMSDRGPDGQGFWTLGRVGLAHRRLKIIDLSESGSQPMKDPQLGLTAVFNGCIYNYQELRLELRDRGYHFFSTSDTEVLLKGYHCWGERFVERLQGMFAFCIVEHDSGRTVLYRDRLGIKPLYLAETSDSLRFASTLPALLAGGSIDTRIDPVALHHYLTWHSVVPAPRTIIEGIRKLPPATLLVIEPDGSRQQQTYWKPPFERNPAYADMTADDWQAAVLEALRRAVNRRMVADVPVGVLLSGGLDSSLIVGLLAEAGQQDLQTFSIGFQDVGGVQGDEFTYSDLIAKHYNTNHHKLRIETQELLPALDGAVAAMSEPMVSRDTVAFYLLSREVVQHVKVVQSGQGADEVFAGYSWYPPVAAAEDSVETYATVFFDRPHTEMAEVLTPEYACQEDVSRAFVAAHFSQPQAGEPLDQALRIDTEVMLVDDPVKRVDNMTMAWGLEARTPFLDHELVELAAACPPQLKLASGGKGVLKEAARRAIPTEVIDRPKGYFPVPALMHLEGDLLALVCDALQSQSARDRGLFQPQYVERLLSNPNTERTTLNGNKLWDLGLLELWLQAHGL